LADILVLAEEVESWSQDAIREVRTYTDPELRIDALAFMGRARDTASAIQDMVRDA